MVIFHFSIYNYKDRLLIFIHQWENKNLQSQLNRLYTYSVVFINDRIDRTKFKEIYDCFFQVLSGIILLVSTDLVLINRSVGRNDLIEAVRLMIG